MNYRSVTDLSRIIRSNLTRIPGDVDLIVGIPRSGMLAANLIALHANLKFCNVNEYLANTPLLHGNTRATRWPNVNQPSDALHVLIVDDSICSGESMSLVRQRIEHANIGCKVSYCAIYAEAKTLSMVDIYFEVVGMPRVFEWNLMHRTNSKHWCFDIDGVLCVDPLNEENDDGENYVNFLNNARPLCLPTHFVGHLVTSRLEKYRGETERWLKKNNVNYGKLHMLDLPDAVTRRNLNCHASFKAKVYSSLGSTDLFIESNEKQAAEIARRSGKYVLCFENQELYSPNVNYNYAREVGRSFGLRIKRKIGKLIRKIIGM